MRSGARRVDEPCQVVEEGFLIEIRLERQAGNYDVEIVMENVPHLYKFSMISAQAEDQIPPSPPKLFFQHFCLHFLSY